MKFTKEICIFAAFMTSLLTEADAEEEYQRVSRHTHNFYRTRHHAGPLQLTDDLNNRAVQCAKHYAAKNVIDHSCTQKNGAGENLWLQGGGNPTDNKAAMESVDAWYSEEKSYNFSKRGFQPGAGHFTQLVWNSSQDLGFGLAKNGNIIVGCALYSPAGNVVGKFRNNVFAR